METPNKKFIPVFIGIGFFVLVLMFLIVWLWKKKQGWMAVWVTYGFGLIIIFMIFLIVVAVWWLFKTQRLDMIHIHKQRIVGACKMNKPTFKQYLMFRGSEELEGRIIGEVLGIAMTKSVPVQLTPSQLAGLKEKNIPEDKIKEFIKPKVLYWITFKRSFMNPPEIFCGTREDFTHLAGSIIYLNGMAFAPPLYDVYFLAKRWQETELIDETITFSIRRYVLQEFLKEEKNIFDDVLAISPQHQKALEQSRMRGIHQDLSSQPNAPPPPK